MRPRIIVKLILVLVLAMSARLTLNNSLVHAKENKALSKTHNKITRQFSSVAHISSDEFSNTLSEKTIVFDVRERPEYDVSHIAGAVHIPPNISPERFIKTYSDMAHGKTAIFYCSVGQRSSHLANNVQGELMRRGTRAVYNLEGGLFKWHNEERTLQSTPDNLTLYIHPYNQYWGRMINDSSKLRYRTDLQ